MEIGHRTVRTRRLHEFARRTAVLGPAFVAYPVALVAIVPVLVVAALVDLLVAPRRLPTVRLVVAGFLHWTLTVVSQVMILATWVLSGFGIWNYRSRTQRAYRHFTAWWVGRLLAIVRLTLGVRLDIDGVDELREGPVLLFPRHVSVIDALVAPGLAVRLPGRSIRVVLMRELRYEPNLDIVGHRVPHHFVERWGDDPAAELAAIGELVSDMPDTCTAILFPEGRLFRPEVRDRIIARLRDTDPDGADRAAALTRVLPPRRGGVLEMLRHAPPGTDVAFMAHVGFEDLTDLATVWRRIPLRAPVRGVVWRIDGTHVPNGEAERAVWLDRQWSAVDAWVVANDAART